MAARDSIGLRSEQGSAPPLDTPRGREGRRPTEKARAHRAGAAETPTTLAPMKRERGATVRCEAGRVELRTVEGTPAGRFPTHRARQGRKAHRHLHFWGRGRRGEWRGGESLGG